MSPKAAWLLAVALAGCGEAQLTLLTYNVAGLPEGLSAGHPARNIPRIGPLLNDYDLVLVQEDFAYHAELAAAAEHAYRSPSETGAGGGGRGIGNPSGLARFARFEGHASEGQSWAACSGLGANGSDCLAPKGFDVAEHRVPVGGAAALIDVYNVHFDSGGGPEDTAARAAQAAQLLDHIAVRSSGKPVIVAGDTNVPDLAALAPLLAASGLVDACAALACAEPERIDRVLFRGTPWVELVPLRWWIPDTFLDAEGNPLSDHLPVAVSFSVTLVPPQARPAAFATP